MLIDLMNENFATKADLTTTESALRFDMSGLRADLSALRSDMNAMEQSIRSDMRELEYKLSTMMTIAIGVTATLVKLIPSHG